MFAAAVGSLAVGDEKGFGLEAFRRFGEGGGFGLFQSGEEGLIDRFADRRIPDPPVPGGSGSPGPDGGTRVPVHHVVERGTQTREADG